MRGSVLLNTEMAGENGYSLPSLLLTKSVLDNAFLHFASKRKDNGRVVDVNVAGVTSEESGGKKITDVKLPAIERPRIVRRRQQQQGRAAPDDAKKEWNVVVRIDWRENTVDKRTIYSDNNNKLLTTLEEDDKTILPPLDCSPRMTAIVPDSQDLAEKVLVIAHNLSMGSKAHYKKDNAALPTVYTSFFGCPERKRKYVNRLWQKYRMEKGLDRNQSRCSMADGRTGSLRPFCDVMGSNYCTFCRELNNRHFALGYEESYFTQNGQSKVSMERPIKRRILGRVDRADLPRETKSLRSNTLLMPIKYLPQEGETRHST